MKKWLYVLACLVVPHAWAVVMYHAFDALDRRRKLAAAERNVPPADYSI